MQITFNIGAPLRRYQRTGTVFTAIASRPDALHSYRTLGMTMPLHVRAVPDRSTSFVTSNPSAAAIDHEATHKIGAHILGTNWAKLLTLRIILRKPNTLTTAHGWR